jgi:hypothetical protein
LENLAKKFGSAAKSSATIDGLSNDVDIANKFADSFAKACSVNSSDRNALMKNKFEEQFLHYKGDDLNDTFAQIDVEMVDNIVRKLKNRQSRWG